MTTATDKLTKFDLTHGRSPTASVDTSAFVFNSCLIATTRNGVATFAEADQAWFWTTSWRSGEREATAEIAAGAPEAQFGSGEEFLAALEDLST